MLAWALQLALDLAVLPLARRWRATRRSWPRWLPYLAYEALAIGGALLLSECCFATRAAGIAYAWPTATQLRWLLLLLLITKPANQSFKRLFARYQLEATRSDFESEPGAGATIGILERLLSALFLAAGQYAAIGLVYTAKSISRYKKMEENRRFAEYYLIGTLYSILFVVVAYALLIGFPGSPG